MAKKDFMSLMKEKTVDVRPSLLSAEGNIKSQIVVLEQLRDLIPPLTSDELTQLEQNVLKHGVKDPLTIWETTDTIAGIGSEDVPVYVLVDGHNRNQIIQKHHLDFRINLVRFASLDEVKDYMIDYQLGRRNLTSEQASYLRGMRYNQQKAFRGSNLRAEAPTVNVAETLAAEYGVSSRTIKRDGEFAASLENADPSIKRDVLAGKLPKSAVQNVTNAGEDESTIDLGSKGNKRITNLQTQIRKLANSDLTAQSCADLLQKTNELMTLLRPK
ncbi:hypothetical protein [uncultured Fibrella sp.]|uniref:hypothetical protein n=1 Tax=uncultured Fibrella sp. TaxID=1284596 RepID=UPI0035CAE2CC